MALSTKKAAGLVSAAFLKQEEKMKYLILKDTVANGGKVSAGDTIELDLDQGNILVGLGKAELAEGKAAEKKDRSIGLEKSEAPKITKRKGK